MWYNSLLDYLKKGCNVGAALVAALFDNNAALLENNADTLKFQFY